MPVTTELPIRGMDCAECARHVQKALAALPGVEEAEVRLSAAAAVVRYDPARVGPADFRRAVSGAGYAVADEPPGPRQAAADSSPGPAASPRAVMALFGLVAGACWPWRWRASGSGSSTG